MTNYIDRMKQEHKELEIKVKSLESFIYTNDKFKELGDNAKVLMIQQLGFMRSYLSILDVRIWSD